MCRGPTEYVENIFGKFIGLEIFTGLTIHAKTPRNSAIFSVTRAQTYPLPVLYFWMRNPPRASAVCPPTLSSMVITSV